MLGAYVVCTLSHGLASAEPPSRPSILRGADMRLPTHTKSHVDSSHMSESLNDPSPTASAPTEKLTLGWRLTCPKCDISFASMRRDGLVCSSCGHTWDDAEAIAYRNSFESRFRDV